MRRGADPVNVEQEGRALVERLGGRWSGKGGMCRCPGHDDRTPSLSVRAGRSRLLLHCFAGCDSAAVLGALQSAGLLEPGAPASGEPALERAGSSLAAAALRIWREARTLDATPAADYLASRGLATQTPELRFHPRAADGPQPLTRYRPALIAAVRDDAGLAGIHRTFIERGAGGEWIAARRRGLGRFGSGAVRIGGPAARMGIAEGIESALSAAALFGIPCWAALGTERFRFVSLPSEVRELVLFLDHDAGGRRAEMLAREALAHVARVEACYPPRPGEDWNDVLRAPLGSSAHG